MTHSNELHQSTTEYSDQAAVEAAKSLSGDYEYSAEEYTPRSVELASDPSLDIDLEGTHNFWQKMAQKAQEFSFNGKKVAAGVLLTATAVLATGCGSDVEAKPTPSVSETPTASPEASEDVPRFNAIEGPKNSETGWVQYFYERNDALEKYPEVKELYDMSIEEFKKQPKESQWLLVSWLAQYKEDFDAHYKYRNTFSEYDPTEETSSNSSAEQLYGEVASYLRIAESTRDPKSPATNPMNNMNETEKIILALSTDPDDIYTQQTIEGFRNQPTSYDIIVQSNLRLYESEQQRIELIEKGEPYTPADNPNAKEIKVKIRGLDTGLEGFTTYRLIEYTDYNGNTKTAITQKQS